MVTKKLHLTCTAILVSLLAVQGIASTHLHHVPAHALHAHHMYGNIDPTSGPTHVNISM